MIKIFEKVLFFLFISVFLFISPVYSLEKIEIDDTHYFYPINKNIEIFLDKSKKLEINEIISQDFLPNTSGNSCFGFSDSVFWLKFSIKNNSSENKKWLLEIDHPSLDKVDFYLPNNEGFSVKKTGDILLFSDRDIKNHNFVFELPLKKGELKNFYLRLETEGSMNFPLNIWSNQEFLNKENKLHSIDGVYYGILILISIYSLVLFVRLKESGYLFYLLYLISFGLFHASVKGTIFEHVPAEVTLLNNLFTPLMSGLAIIFLILFSRSFLNSKNYAPVISKLLNLIGILTLFFVSLAFLNYYRFSVISLTISSLIAVSLILLVSFKAMLKGNHDASYFLVGWSIFFIGVFIFCLRVFGLFPDNYFAINALQFGSIFQIMLFSFAITEKIIFMQKQAEKAKQEVLISNEQSLKNLRNSDKLKDDILANTSHELKTPLNGIIGIAESLIDGVSGELSDKTIANLSLIVSNGKRLENLINDIIDFSKLKNHDITLALKPVDIKKLTDLVILLSKSLLKEKSLKIINEISADFVPANADENRLQQILHNFIGNAIKFTESGTIKISALQKEEVIEITVSDTGIGIPVDKQEAIFNFFEQVDSSVSREYSGIGLGLSINKHLVELHAGKVSLKSEVGKGSEFTFSVPVSHEKIDDISEIDEMISQSSVAKEIVKISDFSEEQPAKKFHILVVDDELINLMVLINILSLQNYQVSKATNGPEALLMVKKQKPDLIILDIMMPKMSGYEVSKKLREVYPANELPIIMLTAKDQDTDLTEGFDSGANDYLTKPVSKNELLARVKTHVQLARLNVSYGRFVPREFLGFLNHQSIVDVELGDQVQKNMTILFSDIRNFTSISESMTPEENFNFLNYYLSEVSPLIRENNGFIDKYIGDAIMALFPDSLDDALKASIEMIRQVNVNNSKLIQKGYPLISIGIGIHTGNLILGIVGEEKRMEGTVISDAVNLASRMEGLTKVYGASIIITEQSMTFIQNPEKYYHRYLGKVSVKGKKEMINIFEIFAGDDEITINLKISTKELFEKAIAIYQRKEYHLALETFFAVFEQNPDDKAVAFYIECCNKFLHYEVPDDWSVTVSG